MTGDLFGDAPAPGDDQAEIRLAMQVVHATDKAWFLRREGRPGPAYWIPKAICARGEGRDASVFTMKRGSARERGWL